MPNQLLSIFISPILNPVSLLVGLTGVILAIIFYKKSQKLKTPTYAIRNFSLVREHISKQGSIGILYKNRKVEDLSVAKVAFWNDGKDTINRNDIAPKDPIRLVALSGNKILEANIIYQKNKTNGVNIKVSPNQKEMFVDFDYLDFEEGFVLQVFHSGSSADDLVFKGTIKGAGEIQSIAIPLFFRKPNAKITKFLHLIKFPDGLTKQNRRLIQGLLMFFAPVIIILMEYLPTPKINSKIPSFVGEGIVTILYWYTGYELVKQRVPKGLELYEDDIRFDSETK